MTERGGPPRIGARQTNVRPRRQQLSREEAVVDARRSQRLLDPLFTTEAMRAIFSDHGRLQAMLDFEAALARAEARAGLIPQPPRRRSARNAAPNASISTRSPQPGGASGQRGDSAGAGTNRPGRGERCRSRALRALGCDQPGRDGYRPRAAAAQRARGDRKRPGALVHGARRTRRAARARPCSPAAPGCSRGPR